MEPRADGVLARLESRWERKHPESERGTGTTWWAPRARGWWIGVLFAVGSTLFALGSIPAYADAVGFTATGITYFVGSVFFTSAALLQFLEAVEAAGRWAPSHLGWLASAVQLVGTLWFNWSTANAVRVDLSATLAHQRVWRPDALGSIAFLVASGLAWWEVCHGAFAWSPRSLAWWITAANLVGSIAFGISALAAYVNPSTGSVANADLADLGTLVGALCFLGGAILLLPERTREPG